MAGPALLIEPAGPEPASATRTSRVVRTALSPCRAPAYGPFERPATGPDCERSQTGAWIGVAYLLHFSKPYKHARHYTGWAIDLDARLALHAAGRGARLLAVVQEAGITWDLARTWPGATRAHERSLKRRGGARRYCPMCGVRPLKKVPVLAPKPPAPRRPGVTTAPPAAETTHVLVRTANPDWLDEFVQELGPAVVVGAPDYVMVDGCYVVRIFADPGYITFGITYEGYGDIVRELDYRP